MEIVSSLAGHLIVTIKDPKSLDINKTRWCKFRYESDQRGVEYSLTTKVKLNPKHLQIHLPALMIPKTRHLTVKIQSALKNSSTRPIIDFYMTNFTMVRQMRTIKTYLHKPRVICSQPSKYKYKLRRKTQLQAIKAF